MSTASQYHRSQTRSSWSAKADHPRLLWQCRDPLWPEKVVDGRDKRDHDDGVEFEWHAVTLRPDV
jgi:hypothetical protein